MWRFKLLLFLVVGMGVLCTVLGALILTDDPRFQTPKEFLQTWMGGKVINRTPYTLTVTNYKYQVTLPAGKNTRDIGLYDADGIVITRPMIFQGVTYQTGVIKFCDFGSYTIHQHARQASLSLEVGGQMWLCNLLKDNDWYPSIRAAF